jgi:hypothetical protein
MYGMLFSSINTARPIYLHQVHTLAVGVTFFAFSETRALSLVVSDWPSRRFGGIIHAPDLRSDGRWAWIIN